MELAEAVGVFGDLGIDSLRMDDSDLECELGRQIMLSQEQSSEALCAIDAAAHYAAGSDVQLDDLAQKMSGLKEVKNTVNNDSWARRKYEFVRAHRAPPLPEDPWALILKDNGCNLVSGALSVAIELVVYSDELPSDGVVNMGGKSFDQRRLPGSTLMLIAMGWNRILRSVVAKHNLTAVQEVDFGSLLTKGGNFSKFYNALNAQMIISTAKKIKVGVNHHVAPSDEQHEKVLDSEAMACYPGTMRGTAKATMTRFCYLLGTNCGLRPGKEKYELTRSEIQADFSVAVREHTRSRLTIKLSTQKTKDGSMEKMHRECSDPVTFCPGMDKLRCMSLEGPFCDHPECLVRVWGDMCARYVGIDDWVFMQVPTPTFKDQFHFQPRRMGIITITKTIPGAFKSIEIGNITGHGARGRYATKCFEAGVPDMLTAMQLRHKDVETTRKNYIKENDAQGAAVSDAVMLGGGVYEPPILKRKAESPPSPSNERALKQVRQHVPGFQLCDLQPPGVPLPLQSTMAPTAVVPSAEDYEAIIQLEMATFEAEEAARRRHEHDQRVRLLRVQQSALRLQAAWQPKLHYSGACPS